MKFKNGFFVILLIIIVVWFVYDLQKEEVEDTTSLVDSSAIVEGESEAVYKNEDKGISFSFPYLENKNDKNVAYKEYDEFVGLVPRCSDDACSYPWKFNLTFKDLVEVFMVESGEENIEINGLIVTKYVGSGLCQHPTMIVHGEKYNYMFSSSCADESTIDAEFEYLEKLIETVELN